MGKILTRKKATVWTPNPGGQYLATSCPFEEWMIHGDRGGGKTETLFSGFTRHVGKGYGKDLVGAFFRCEFKHLGDAVKKSKILFPKIFPGAKWLNSASQFKWVFPGGEELLFRHAKNADDYDQFHGHEIPIQLYDELTKFPSMDFYESMKSCLRSSIKGMPKLQASATNPSGVSHNEVKAYMIDQAPAGVPIMGDDGIPRVHIKVSFLENPYIRDNDPTYIKRLKAIKDPYLRAAWLEGDWNIVSGGAFDDLFDQSIHVYDPSEVEIPSNWKITRGFDWGQSAPFSFGWNAICPSNQVIRWGDGERRISKGTMFRIYEYYGAKEEVKNTGLRLTNEEMANIALGIEKSKGWKVSPGVADSAIFADPTQKQKDMYQTYKKKGIKFVPSVKGPGSRMTGMSLFRDRLEASFPDVMEEPGYFISNVCRQAIKQIPLLKRDEKNIEEVDTDQEDHLYDEIRYQFQNYETYGAMFTP